MSSIFIVDTSALIDFEIYIPQDIFQKTWTKFESLIPKKEIIAPIEVYKEISPSNIL